MLDRNKKEIVLFGVRVCLFERTAGEVNAVASYVKENGSGRIDLTTNLVLSLDVMKQSLRPNFTSFLIFKNPLRWLQLKRIISTKYLMRNLTVNQITDYCKIILEDLEKNPAGEKKKD